MEASNGCLCRITKVDVSKAKPRRLLCGKKARLRSGNKAYSRLLCNYTRKVETSFNQGWARSCTGATLLDALPSCLSIARQRGTSRGSARENARPTQCVGHQHQHHRLNDKHTLLCLFPRQIGRSPHRLSQESCPSRLGPRFVDFRSCVLADNVGIASCRLDLRAAARPSGYEPAARHSGERAWKDFTPLSACCQ